MISDSDLTPCTFSRVLGCISLPVLLEEVSLVMMTKLSVSLKCSTDHNNNIRQSLLLQVAEEMLDLTLYAVTGGPNSLW